MTNPINAIVATLMLGVSPTVLASEIPAHIETAISHPDRPMEDVARDPGRKPAEVLTFAGLKQGMTVVDVNSAGGYYTEILSRAVGNDGKVIAQNDPTYRSYLTKEQLQKRYGSGRLSNVSLLDTPSDPITTEPNSVDLITIMLAFHDYYFKTKERNNAAADVDSVVASLYEITKPGGSVVVIDHVGPDEGDPELWHKLHRISPKLTQRLFEKAGFKLVKTSDALANSDNPSDLSPFDPKYRGQTNRFIHLYQKPTD